MNEKSLAKTRVAPALDASERCHVLIVDDNRDAADLMSMLVEMHGHTTDVAYGAAEAQTKARARCPDVVLLDLGMPQQDGHTLAAVFRADAKLKSARLVAITGSSREEDRSRALAAGFAAYVTKPADMDAIAPFLVPAGQD